MIRRFFTATNSKAFDFSRFLSPSKNYIIRLLCSSMPLSADVNGPISEGNTATALVENKLSKFFSQNFFNNFYIQLEFEQFSQAFS